MSEVFLRLIGCDDSKNQVEIEKHQLSSWADQMASVEASAKSLLEYIYTTPASQTEKIAPPSTSLETNKSE